MSQLRQRLKIVWNNREPKRYQPRALEGGPGWGVFDFKEDRFLSDTEVRQISKDDLLTQTITH